jgi:tetratricopeptide (TPR) repeat protein
LGILYLSFIGRYAKPLCSIDIYNTSIPLKTGIVTATVIGVALAVTYVGKIYNSFSAWNTGDMVAHTGNAEGALPYYKSAYALLGDDGAFLLEYGNITSALKQYNQSLYYYHTAEKYCDNSSLRTSAGNILLILKKAGAAEHSYLSAVNMCPNKLYPKYKLLQLYVASGRKAQVYATIKAILATREKAESSAGNEILSYARTLTDSLKNNR